MADIAAALGPAFATGFCVQRILELLDPFLPSRWEKQKKLIFSIISLIAGLILAFAGGIRVLKFLSPTLGAPDALDAIVTALIVSGGTEGFNSIMKFLGYKKEATKADAAEKTQAQKPEALAAMASK